MSEGKSHASHAAVEDVLSAVSIEEACRANDIPIVKGNLILCPAHPVKMGKRNTNYGNCNIYKDTNTFTCHSCHTTGNVIELTMYAQDLPYSEAIDWLAAQCAPWLLTGARIKQKAVKKCPFEDEELEDLGLVIKSRNVLPVALAPSKYAATHEAKEDEFDWSLEERDFVSDSGSIMGKYLRKTVPEDIVLCKTETMDIKDLFREDPQAFRAIVIGKAKALLLESSKELGHMMQASCGTPLAGEFQKIMKQKTSSAWHVINYYNKIDRIKKGKALA